MVSKADFVKAYVLSAVQGFANGKGNIDVTEILDDAEHFYDEMDKRYGLEAKVSKKKEE